jgi:thiol-disulfide isomerase/thioredoxin
MTQVNKERMDGFIHNPAINLVICKFGAEWCEICKALDQVLHRLSDEYRTLAESTTGPSGLFFYG